MEYTGSFDIVPSEDGPPDSVPDECSLCADLGPGWWYVVEPVRDSSNRIVGSVALARWWAICATCHQLVAANAVDPLQERLGRLQRRDEVLEILALFVRQARPWVEVVS
jgi:hypothetical protein